MINAGIWAAIFIVTAGRLTLMTTSANVKTQRKAQNAAYSVAGNAQESMQKSFNTPCKEYAQNKNNSD